VGKYINEGGAKVKGKKKGLGRWTGCWGYREKGEWRTTRETLGKGVGGRERAEGDEERRNAREEGYGNGE